MNIQTPAARNTDPVTAHEAADAITRSGRRAAQQHIALEAVRAFPGMTSAELAAHCSLDRFQAARRLPEVALSGAIVRGDPRKCMVGRRRAMTWHPA